MGWSSRVCIILCAQTVGHWLCSLLGRVLTAYGVNDLTAVCLCGLVRCSPMEGQRDMGAMSLREGMQAPCSKYRWLILKIVSNAWAGSKGSCAY